MKEKISRHRWWLIGTVVLIAIVYFVFYYYLPYKKAERKCFEYVLYNPERQAYRWKFEFTDEWYKTQKDAMDACINTQKEIFKP